MHNVEEKVILTLGPGEEGFRNLKLRGVSLIKQPVEMRVSELSTVELFLPS